MKVGLLWFDDDPRRELEEKVERAAQRYREKHGRWPNACYVHPGALASLERQQGPIAFRVAGHPTTVAILSSPSILPHHYWLGVESGKPAAGKKQPAG